MRTEIARWGNSLALPLPRPIADQAGIAEGPPLRSTSKATNSSSGRCCRATRWTNCSPASRRTTCPMNLSTMRRVGGSCCDAA